MTENVVRFHSNRFIDLEGKKQVVRKKFNGVVVTSSNYSSLMEEGGRDIINYHNKHLKAYKKDENWFSHGRNEDGTAKMHPVLKQFFLEAA